MRRVVCGLVLPTWVVVVAPHGRFQICGAIDTLSSSPSVIEGEEVERFAAWIRGFTWRNIWAWKSLAFFLDKVTVISRGERDGIVEEKYSSTNM